MASSSSSKFLSSVEHLLIVLLVACCNLITPAATSNPDSSCYSSIFSFGDSGADTGNFLLYNPGNTVGNPPYGETYFHDPTGRYSDGRVVIDYIAQAYGIPLLPPSLSNPKPSKAIHGVNFAVGGGPTLDISFLEEKNITQTLSNYTLGVQLGWFNDLLPSLCYSESACRDFLKKSLFVIGGFGGNDYGVGFIRGRTIEELRDLAPYVVARIGNAVEEVIYKGGREFVVPGLPPFGCVPLFLILAKARNMTDYDEHGCIKSVNNLINYHSSLLHQEIKRLRHTHPHAKIVYADYYNAAWRLYENPSHFGLADSTLMACCGEGAPYNYNPLPSQSCGNSGIHACSDPSKHISWDGVHFTEKAYELVAQGFLSGNFTYPPMNPPKRCCS